MCFLEILRSFAFSAWEIVLGNITAKLDSPNPTPTKPWTYRVHEVPLEWDLSDLQKYLNTHFPVSQVKGRSLALEAHGKHQTATVDSLDGTMLPRDLCAVWSRGSESQGEELQLQTDDHFYGLTTLYVPPVREHFVDVVAISGLGSHPFGSFRNKDPSDPHMWLRDALPSDLTRDNSDQPMARIMIYGYRSKVANGDNAQNVGDLAIALLQTLSVLDGRKPLVVIAHSLGGLIVKEAIIKAGRSRDEGWLSFLQSIYGIAFFGVPHLGMRNSTFIAMAGSGPNLELVVSLSDINSYLLSEQKRNFVDTLGPEGRAEVYCFYEQQPSPTAVLVNGKWKMEGPKTFLVNKNSATHCRHWEDNDDHIRPMDTTHSGLVKFHRTSHIYRETVAERLRTLCQRAYGVRERLCDKNVKFLVSYEDNSRDFIGRESTLEQIEAQFQFRDPPSQRRCRKLAIWGLGGIGKTQIAISFAYQVKRDFPDRSVFWVHGGSRDRFRDGYGHIAKEFAIPGHEDPQKDVLKLVADFLSRDFKRPWLLIIDNADNQKLFFPSSSDDASAEIGLKKYIPRSDNGAVLMTTRDMQMGLKHMSDNDPLQIVKFSKKESVAFIRQQYSPNTSQQDAEDLAKQLEYIPLALKQAIAFIKKTGKKIRWYCNKIEASDPVAVQQLSQEFEVEGRDESTNAVAKTWIISFEEIRGRDDLAIRLLSFMSLLNRQELPETLIADYQRSSTPSDVEEAGGAESPTEMELERAESLGTLKSFAFITSKADDTYEMHRLVQLVTRNWLDKEGKIDTFLRDALVIISDKFPWGGEFENWTLCRTYLPHANMVLGLKKNRREMESNKNEENARALLFTNLGGLALSEGRWNDSEKLFQDAKRIMERILGSDHRDTLAIMANLASTFWNQGRWEEAEELDVQVMETSKIKLGADHPDTLTSMANLASTYRNQGRWEEAEELDVQVRETSKMKLGADHPNTLTSMANLASTFWNQGRWEEAEELDVQVIETRKIKLGADHPNTLTSMANLASTYRNQGRWEEAEGLEVQVMETRKIKLGADHPNTLTSMANLASTYRNQGRWEEAEGVEVQVMETRKIKLRADHPDTLTSMANLASTFWNQGRWEEAEELDVQVMETRKIKLRADHPDTLTSMANLASTFWNQGRWEEAEELDVQVMETSKMKLGADHPDTLTSMNNLAHTWHAMGRRPAAIDMMRDCTRLRKMKLGPAHHHTQLSMSTLRDWEHS